jgi:1-acyl-sn-glycerol-3-phosphate acyltransferase
MIGRLRIGVTLALVIAVTPVAILLQMGVLRTRALDPGTLPRLWHAFALRLLGIRVHVEGEPATGRPLLIVANHVSWSDICVLGSLGPYSFVAKSDMARWPVFGTLARLQRSVFVERERTRASHLQARELGERLGAGEALVLFAEGTTYDGNTVGPFKSTLFGAAQAALSSQAGLETVHVQPVSIAYTRLHGMPMGRFHRTHAAWIGDMDLVPHVGALLREGGMDVEVRFGEPIPFSRGANRKEIARLTEAEVRRNMAASLREPRPTSPASTRKSSRRRRQPRFG